MSNVGQALGTVAGATLGFFVGGPLGAIQGASIGYSLGAAIFPTKLPGVQGPRLEDLSITISTYGNPIPLIYGTFRAAGNVIWATNLVEVATTTEQGGKGGGGQDVTNFSYFGNFAVAFAGRDINQVLRIWANKKVVFDTSSPDNPTPTVMSDGVSLLYDFPGRGEVRIYHGNQTIPDDRIVSFEGVGQVPNYKNTAYIVFTGANGYALADFGNAMPNIEAEIEADEFISAGEIIQDITERAGVTVAGNIWIDQECLGYAIGTSTNATNALIPLALAFDFDMIEEYHQISIIQRPRALSATIEEDDFGAYNASGSQSVLLPLVRNFEAALPIRVDVSYPDPDYDYQKATQSVTRQQVRGDLVRTEEVPVVISADTARQIATRIMWGQAGERITATVFLSDKWRFLRAGETIALPVPGGHFPFRIVNIMRGQDNTMQVDVVYDDAASYIYGLAGAEPTPPDNPFGVSQPSTWMVLDAPLLTTTSSQTGLYWGVHSGEDWRGATFKRSLDGVNFTTIAGVSQKARIGDVALALPAGSAEGWDEINKITVVMRSDDVPLNTVSDVDVFNGANALWLGDEDGNASGEVLQFGTATLIAPETYELTGLLRGRLGTEFAMGLHTTNQVLVMLQMAVFDTDFGLADWNASRDYVAYSRYVDESLQTPRPFTNTGERARPRSPAFVRGERDVSNNLTITWVPRTRIPVTGLADLVPLGETVEAYEIDILSGLTVVRTIASSTPTASYSAAEQTADGLTPGNPVNMNVYMLSTIRGRGHERFARV